MLIEDQPDYGEKDIADLDAQFIAMAEEANEDAEAKKHFIGYVLLVLVIGGFGLAVWAGLV